MPNTRSMLISILQTTTVELIGGAKLKKNKMSSDILNPKVKPEQPRLNILKKIKGECQVVLQAVTGLIMSESAK